MEGASIARLGVLWALVAAAACGGPSPEQEMATWAAEADEVVAELTGAYDAEDSYQTARFYSAGGTLDLTIWGHGVAKRPDAVVSAVEDLWFQQPGFASRGTKDPGRCARGVAPTQRWLGREHSKSSASTSRGPSSRLAGCRTERSWTV